MALSTLGCLSSGVTSRLILAAILTATPTNFREKERSEANDEPFRPALVGRGECRSPVFAASPFGLPSKKLEPPMHMKPPEEWLEMLFALRVFAS